MNSGFVDVRGGDGGSDVSGDSVAALVDVDGDGLGVGVDGGAVGIVVVSMLVGGKTERSKRVRGLWSGIEPQHTWKACLVGGWRKRC